MKNDKFDYPFLFSYDETKKQYSVIEAIDVEDETIHVQRGINCHENYIKEINDKIKNKELVVYDPSQYGIVLVDISGYSKGNTQYQAALLSLFHQYIKQNIQIYQIFSPFEIVEGFVPTGNGCYIIFNKNINDRILRLGFALISGFKTFQYQTLRQKKDLKSVSKFLTLRVSCIIGECSEFVDLSERINYFGTGMNEAARVLNYGRKEFEKTMNETSSENVLFIDDSVVDQVPAIIQGYVSEKPKSLNMKNVKDKHGIERNITAFYEIPHGIMFNLFTSEERIKYNTET